MNMKKWMAELPTSGKPLPILTFPSASLLGVSVYDLTHSAELQTKGIVLLSSRLDSAAAVSMMDLSVEAEAFGCRLKTEENEIPTVLDALITDEDEARELQIPKVGAARTGMYIKAVADAKKQISDKPVFAGMIGPFSLCGRLMEITEALVNCIADPDFVNVTMQKTTAFLIEYAKAYKASGVDGIILAEPLSGLLSPELEAEFSGTYVKKLINEVQDEEFAVIYHNCGPNTPKMAESLTSIGAYGYHFGDAVRLKDVLDVMPSDCPVLGNISPTNQFLGGTPESMTEAVGSLIAECGGYPNFVLSSGCDIPPAAKWENIDAFFAAAKAAHTKA